MTKCRETDVSPLVGEGKTDAPVDIVIRELRSETGDQRIQDAAAVFLSESCREVRELRAEVARMRDLLQQVCEPCAFGEERHLDPVFGQYKHPVTGVYGVSEVRCEIGRSK